MQFASCAPGPPKAFYEPAGLPQNATASFHYSKGHDYLVKNLNDQAILEFKESIRIEPTAASAHHNLGIAYYGQGSFDLAVEALEEAKRLNPLHVRTHYWLGNANYAAQSFVKAADEYGQFIKLMENAGARWDPMPFPLLQALAYLRAGQTTQAELLLEHLQQKVEVTMTGTGQAVFVGKSGLSSWGKTVARYLVGEVGEEKVLGGSRKGERVYADLFVGINNIINNNLEKAKKHLLLYVQKFGPNDWSYWIAKSELDNIEK